MEKLKKYLWYGGIGREEYEQILPEIRKDNRKSLMAFSLVACGFLIVMFFISFIAEDATANRWVYMGSALLMVLLFLIARYYVPEHFWILAPCIYVFVGILFVFGIILGTITRPDEQTVTFIALLLTVPLLFTDRPARMILCTGVYVIIFNVAAFYIKERYVLKADIIDASIFGAVSAVVSSYMMTVKYKRHLFECRTGILSRTDLLTGLCNRNSYEQSLKEYPMQCQSSIACVYIDANGLHELNNSKGHEAGDRMLQMIAYELQDGFGEKDTYRIGGDEFVAFALDCEEKEIQRKIGKFVRSVKEAGYAVSIGCVVQNVAGIDMAVLIREAEKRMYADKEKYYEQTGSCRR